jgi:hypothetical protein
MLAAALHAPPSQPAPSVPSALPHGG